MTPKLFDLTGKVALVTGGNGGIGLGMADALASCGADVAIWGTNEGKNAKAKEQLEAHGKRVLAQRVDVSDEAAVDAAVAEIIANFGRIDTAIANAGIGGPSKRIPDLSTKEWHDVLAINLDGVFYTLRAVTRTMIERCEKGDTGGSLAVVSSLAAIEASGRYPAYSAAKAGINAMIRGLAAEYGHHGIRANAILPGWIATDMTATGQSNDKVNAFIKARVPMGRWGDAADFGGIAVYLSSDASAYHSGDTLLIDGAYAVY